MVNTGMQYTSMGLMKRTVLKRTLMIDDLHGTLQDTTVAPAFKGSAGI